MSFTRTLIAAALFATAVTAHAQTSIDHDKALAGSVTPGDLPGYPIEIKQAGHYVLKSNLMVPGGVNGIQVTVPNVTIDMNGFTVQGPKVCQLVNQLLSCSGASGFHYGVLFTDAALGAVLRNGRSNGFSGAGVAVSEGSVEDVSASQNAVGMYLGNTTGLSVRARNVSGSLNGSTGIQLQAGVIDGANAFHNAGSGFVAGMGKSLISNAVAHQNSGYGFRYGAVRATASWGNKTGNTQSVTSLGANISEYTPY